MKRTLLSLIAHWAGGEIHGDDVAIDAVSNDTRSLGPGSLYVALRGERFDGHDFAADAQARGATILAEVVGYGTNSDGQHVTQPSADTMAQAMRLALEDAGLEAAQINYVNAHGTATDHGDIAETQATAQVFGSRVPISSLKSYVGHMLGACGAFEAWLSIEMMRAGWFAPTLNLAEVDPRCGQLDFITGQGRELQAEYVMSNNFAFGGINTSLVFRRWSE